MNWKNHSWLFKTQLKVINDKCFFKMEYIFASKLRKYLINLRKQDGKYID